jgi:hypothetical protein
MTQEILVVSETQTLVQDIGSGALVEQVAVTEFLTVAEQGPPGPPGGGVSLNGRLPSLSALPETGELGDLFIIEDQDNHGYVWTGVEWADAGPIQGPRGEAGPPGATGATGATGPVGPPGATGATGATGAQGPIGPAGPQGPIGPAGSQGPVGPMGPAGPAGAQGPKGDDGERGADGEQGPQGIQGIQGIQGLPGTNGADGADGSDGLSAYEIALANGFVGNEAVWLASLVGPTGADGAQGPQGEQGPAGLNGEGSGTVTSVALTMPDSFEVSGSPVTESGTLSVALSAGRVIPTQTQLDALAPKVPTVQTITGTSPTISTTGGEIKVWVLTGNSTLALDLASGEALTLHVTRDSHTLTLPSIRWSDGTAPTLHATDENVIEFWAVGASVYGAYVGAFQAAPG